MSHERSDRRYADPHPQRADAPQAEGVDAGLDAARARARRAEDEGYIRGYATVEHDDGAAEFEIELKYFDGEPVIREIAARVASPAAASMRRSKILPRVANGLGISILSTPKGVMADHEARDARTWAAKYSARCSKRTIEGTDMSRIGKKAGSGAVGVTVNVERPDRHRQGAEGRAEARRSSITCTVKQTTASIAVDPRDETKRARSLWGMSRTLIANMVERRHRRLRAEAGDPRRRLSRRDAGQGPEAEARLQPRSRLSRSRRASTIAAPKQTEIMITGIDKQQVGQVAAEIREFAPPEPYKGKGVRMSANTSSARKARRSNGAHHGHSNQRDSSAARRASASAPSRRSANGRPRLSVHPLAQEHLCPDHRRREGRHAGCRLDAREGLQGDAQDRRRHEAAAARSAS